MKHLNFLSNLLSLSLGSQSSDVSLDRRLTVGSPSGRYCSGLIRLVFILAILLTLGVGNAWGATTTLAGWTFTSSSYPSNTTNFTATTGTMTTSSTFYLNGSGSTWNASKSTYAFTSVTDITITLTLTQAVPAGTVFTLSTATYYNKASNAPMKGFSIKAKEGSGSFGTTGVGTTSWSLSTSSATKTTTYTTQVALASGTAIAFQLTGTGKAGSGQGYMNNITITATTYDVTYNGNSNTGGSVPTDNVKYITGTTVTVKANSGSLAKTGYTFSGWNTQDDGNGTNYTAGSGTFTITSDKTLYAKWVSAGPACTDPSAPGNSSVLSTGATITFSESGNYDIYYSTSATAPTGATAAITTVSSASSKALTGLAVGTTYYYWARKDCGGSKSDYVAGDPTSFTTTVPAPTGLSMTPSLYGVTFGITDANNVNNYEIYYSTTNSAPGASPSGTATTTTKSKEVTGLPASTTYYCWVRAKGPNANSSWYSAGSFATLTLSSISVSTAPTKTKYLVGDNFDPTALVITRTYSNSTSDTYSYAGHTGDFSFSPATNAALTADDDAVTITYGGKSVSQSINVYSVTVNKVDMDGNAIADAGVTASCSGRTLSQSVSTTNYKFNSWVLATASGTSLSTNTLTGTPTGNVVVNAKFHKPITVTWKVGSGAASGGTSEVKYGTAIAALPSTPADNAIGACANKFKGWSATSELIGTGNSAPADLFTSASDAGVVALTSPTTYRAVFATSYTTKVPTPNTYTHTIESKTWEGTGSQTLTSKSWSLSNNGGYYGYDATKGQQVGSGSSPATSMTLSSSAFSGTITSVKISTSGASSISATVGVSVGSTDFTKNGDGLTKTVSLTSTNTEYTFSGSATGTITISWAQTSSKAIYFKKIVVGYTTMEDGTDYKDYVTECCTELGSINGSFF